jgi:hypothetical protein
MGTHWIVGCWVSPTAGLDNLEKWGEVSCPARIQTPSHPVHIAVTELHHFDFKLSLCVNVVFFPQVDSRHLNFLWRCFWTVCPIFIGYMEREQIVFRNVGTENSDTEESPTRKNTTFTIVLVSHEVWKNLYHWNKNTKVQRTHCLNS